ncbi:MAG: nitroreductase family protein [Spirochaetaceae bacterium]
MNETIDLIMKRKSERGFLNKAISNDDKEIILESAFRAPTAGNMMLYSILEVDKQEDKDKLVKTCDDQPFIAKSPLVLIFLADMQRWYDYFEHSGVRELCKKNGTDFEGPKESDLILASSDAIIAAQNTVIAAEALGIGSCYIGDIIENIEIHREMFNLPDKVFPVAMLCYGYKKEGSGNKKLTSRFPKEYIHFKNSYKRIDSNGFEDMFKQLKEERFSDDTVYKRKGADNIGQLYYLNKTGATFTKEMRRSVKVGIQDWNKDLT